MGKLLFYFAIVIYTAYIAVMHNEPLVVTLLTFFILFPLFLLLFCFLQKRAVRVHLEIPVRATQKGQAQKAVIIIENRFFLPVNHIKLTLHIMNPVTKETARHSVKGYAPSHGKKELSLSLESVFCGSLLISIKKIRIYDPTGLFSISGKIRQEPQELTVYPVFYPSVITMSEFTKNYPLSSDVYDPNHSGEDPSEVFGIREYREGDRMQTVHWKLSSRFESDLYVKEYSRPLGYPVIFFLYPPKKMFSNLYDRFNEIICSISQSLLDCGCKHYLAFYDGEEQDLRRFPVEQNEDLYLFLSVFLKKVPAVPAIPCKALYEEKYKGETFCTTLELTENLTLLKNDAAAADFRDKNPEEELRALVLSV